MNSQSKQAQRYYLLDIARAGAAIVVLIWHYQHFQFVVAGELPVGFDRSSQPAFELLWPFYLYGHYAVQFFFYISGFVIFSQYAERIEDHSVNARIFFILRFSRLYPLHFVSLILTAILQFCYHAKNGSFAIYAWNDWYHFALNLLFVSHWGLQKGWSFNAPIWSVSVEILLYLSFFLAARFQCLNRMAIASLGITALVSIEFLPLAPGTLHDVLTGALCFYTGGVIYNLSKKLRPRKLFIYSLVMMIVGCIAAKSLAEPRLPLLLFLFPGTISFLASLQMIYNSAGQVLGKIGNLTYALYLMHIPFQLFLMFSASVTGYEIPIRSTEFLGFYIVALIFIGWLVFRFFEMPAQRMIRTRMLASKNV